MAVPFFLLAILLLAFLAGPGARDAKDDASRARAEREASAGGATGPTVR